MSTVRQRLRALLVQRLRPSVERALAPAAQASLDLSADREAVRQAKIELDAGLARLESAVAARRAPFAPRMTVHEAWARHPGVRRAFARRGLPACTACAVGADETLEEVAFGYGFDLDELLVELGDLLTG